ncbi:leucine-rich repeat domain-containing protein [Arsenicibacter rosenii]|uniref:Disease resistance R13L4/SHOC-2-like LRR domain-containing protein n=1 Tax=Arsenicibacter rosenii TaxID=1750698 RepID=A0A1S2VDN1_9BACT|nr:tetratricopeptide repeat protein [Arsenicibacter rosenii]OIN56834.1 hypothetical protein BLX24_22950 [Arsenicibacter rosenii]
MNRLRQPLLIWVILWFSAFQAFSQTAGKGQEAKGIWEVGIPVIFGPGNRPAVNGTVVKNLKELIEKQQEGKPVYTVSLTTRKATHDDWHLLARCPEIRTVAVSLMVGDRIDSLFMALETLPNLEELTLSVTTFSMNRPRQQLMQFPASLGRLKALKSVYLYGAAFDYDQAFQLLATNNRLTALHLEPFLSETIQLPPTMGQLRQLESLTIGGASMLLLPEEITGLKNLKKLSLSGLLPTEAGSLQWLSRLKSLETIDIAFAETNQILSQMRIQNGRLTMPPNDAGQKPATFTFASLSGLTNLRSLKLTGNRTRIAFPEDGFRGLPRLESVTLKGLRIHQPLTGLCELTNLKELRITKSFPGELPDCLHRLSVLEVLDLESDSLTALPAGVFGLSNLRELNLRENPLQQLPAAIGQLKELKTLGLNETGLTTLPASIGQLTKLEDLDLRNNQLTALPDELTRLTRLRSLNVFGNQLTSLPANLTRLTQLRSLVVLGNQLTQLPADLGKLRLLHTLNIDQNAITALPESIGTLDSLQRLFIGENQLTLLPEGLAKLRNLRELYIGRNKLGALPASLGSLAKLESFHLSENPIRDLPASIGDWRAIRQVYIQHVPVRFLPATVGNWQRLTSLNIEDSDLMTLPREIGQCARLERLIIKRGNVFGLPESMGQLSQLNELMVTGKTGDQSGSSGLGEMQKLPDSLKYCTGLRALRIQHQREFDAWHMWQLLPYMPQLSELDLTNCGLTELPSAGYERLGINRLVLANNRLTRVPAELGNVPELRWVDLTDNPVPTGMSQPFSNIDQLVLLIAQQEGTTAGTSVALTRAYISGGVQKMEYMNSAEALNLFDKAMAVAPDSLKPMVYGFRADVHFSLKKYAEALADYQKAIEQAPLLPKGSTNGFSTVMVYLPEHYLAGWLGRKGMVEGEMGNTEAALADLNASLKRLPEKGADYSRATFQLAEGRLLAQQNQLEKARASFAKALDLYDTDLLYEQMSYRSQRATAGSELIAAALALLTNQLSRADAILTRYESRTTPEKNSGIGTYFRLCQEILAGKKTQAQAIESFTNQRRLQTESLSEWMYTWYDKTLLSLPLPKEQKEALTQLTALAKSMVRKSE